VKFHLTHFQSSREFERLFDGGGPGSDPLLDLEALDLEAERLFDTSSFTRLFDLDAERLFASLLLDLEFFV